MHVAERQALVHELHRLLRLLEGDDPHRAYDELDYGAPLPEEFIGPSWTTPEWWRHDA